MKKIALLAAFGLSLCFNSQAQKIYKTNNAQIKFVPFDDNVGINKQVQSIIQTSTGQIAFSLLIKGFKFDNSLLQDHFNENYMESTKFPNAKFSGTIVDLKSIDFNKNGTYNVKVKGTLTIHGTPKEMEVPATIIVNNGKLQAKATVKIVVKEFGIKGSYIGEKIKNNLDLLVEADYE